MDKFDMARSPRDFFGLNVARGRRGLRARTRGSVGAPATRMPNESCQSFPCVSGLAAALVARALGNDIYVITSGRRRRTATMARGRSVNTQLTEQCQQSERISRGRTCARVFCFVLFGFNELTMDRGWIEARLLLRRSPPYKPRLSATSSFSAKVLFS